MMQPSRRARFWIQPAGISGGKLPSVHPCPKILALQRAIFGQPHGRGASMAQENFKIAPLRRRHRRQARHRIAQGNGTMEKGHWCLAPIFALLSKEFIVVETPGSRHLKSLT
jgi:hypothetical protein